MQYIVSQACIEDKKARCLRRKKIKLHWFEEGYLARDTCYSSAAYLACNLVILLQKQFMTLAIEDVAHDILLFTYMDVREMCPLIFPVCHKRVFTLSFRSCEEGARRRGELT